MAVGVRFVPKKRNRRTLKDEGPETSRHKNDLEDAQINGPSSQPCVGENANVQAKDAQVSESESKSPGQLKGEKHLHAWRSAGQLPRSG